MHKLALSSSCLPTCLPQIMKDKEDDEERKRKREKMILLHNLIARTLARENIYILVHKNDQKKIYLSLLYLHHLLAIYAYKMMP